MCVYKRNTLTPFTSRAVVCVISFYMRVSLPRSSDFSILAPCRPRASISQLLQRRSLKWKKRRRRQLLCWYSVVSRKKSQLPSRKNQRERTIADVCKTQKTLFHLRNAEKNGDLKKSFEAKNEKHWNALSNCLRHMTKQKLNYLFLNIDCNLTIIKNFSFHVSAKTLLWKCWILSLF